MGLISSRLFKFNYEYSTVLLSSSSLLRYLEQYQREAYVVSMAGKRNEEQEIPALGRGRGVGLSLGVPRGKGGKGRGGTEESPALFSSSSSSAASSSKIADAAIRATDNDAVGSRIAAIQHGYLDADSYSTLLGPTSPPAPRPPIINIGTYLRCRAVDSLVSSFLEQGTGQKQIISLGAGSDSRYWRLYAEEKSRGKLKHYVEFDFPELTLSKVEKITRHKDLMNAVSLEGEDVRISSDRASLQSNSYSLLDCDLRTLASSTSLTERIKSVLDPKLDTLILAECVLAYLSPTSSTTLLQHFATLLNRPFAICYEMCVSGDTKVEFAEPSKFGIVMLNNLQARHLSMPGARAYSTVESHARRFEKALQGSSNSEVEEPRGSATTLKYVWQNLDDEQRQRLSRLQGLDEVEELEILLSHYAVSWYTFDARSSAITLPKSL